MRALTRFTHNDGGRGPRSPRRYGGRRLHVGAVVGGSRGGGRESGTADQLGPHAVYPADRQHGRGRSGCRGRGAAGHGRGRGRRAGLRARIPERRRHRSDDGLPALLVLLRHRHGVHGARRAAPRLLQLVLLRRRRCRMSGRRRPSQRRQRRRRRRRRRLDAAQRARHHHRLASLLLLLLLRGHRQRGRHRRRRSRPVVGRRPASRRHVPLVVRRVFLFDFHAFSLIRFLPAVRGHATAFGRRRHPIL